MKKGNNKMMLLQLVKKCLLVVITLFSVLAFVNKVDARAGFAYKDFNWQEFREGRYDYWGDTCANTLGQLTYEQEEWCNNVVLKNEEKFYTKLYSILADMEEEGLEIDDDIILQTVFYGMDPDLMDDPGEDYKQRWETQVKDYNLDESETDTDPKVDVVVKTTFWDMIIDTIKSWFSHPNEDGYIGTYFQEETDSLKALIHNMVSYQTVCYGELGDAKKNQAGEWTCEDYGSGTYKHIPWTIFSSGYANGLHGDSGDKCVDEYHYTLNYYIYFSSKWEHQWYPLANTDGASDWYGDTPVDPGWEQCKELDEVYEDGASYEYLEDEDSRKVDTEVYFDFLKLTKYFDRKAHLQYLFKPILQHAKVECLTSNVCDNSLEALGDDKYEEYLGDIIEVRLRIIDAIILDLHLIGVDVDYSGLGDGEFVKENEEESVRRSYYWPIGSDETEERDGITYADGEPASTDVIRYFGENKNPITGEMQMHYGIDIAGVEGVTNVISVGDGEVITAYTGCTSGDYSCNDGYGNQIIVASSNGDYIVYGHLSDVLVNVGDSVKKGQLIAHVGSTGDTNVPCLHWEIRVGGNDVEHAVDPLNTTSPSNPRPADMQGDFDIHSTSLTREEFIKKMVQYCNTHSCSSGMQMFANNAGEIYDVSVANNLNPEFVVVRAMTEGFSPGGSTHNYWGIGCKNTGGGKDCATYGSLAQGIVGLASMKIVKNSQTASDLLRNGYAHIGAYWYNPGGWGLGGCPYFPYIKEYMSPARVTIASAACVSGRTCTKDGGGSCVPTTAEDQDAYITWQLNNKMAPYRYNVFGF